MKKLDSFNKKIYIICGVVLFFATFAALVALGYINIGDTGIQITF